jgi:hypothetical protein
MSNQEKGFSPDDRDIVRMVGPTHFYGAYKPPREDVASSESQEVPDVSGRDARSAGFRSNEPLPFAEDPVANADQFARFVTESVDKLGDEGMCLIEAFDIGIPILNNWRSGRNVPPLTMREEVVKMLSATFERLQQEKLGHLAVESGI